MNTDNPSGLPNTEPSVPATFPISASGPPSPDYKLINSRSVNNDAEVTEPSDALMESEYADQVNNEEEVTEPSDALMESEYADQVNNEEEVTEPSDALMESEYADQVNNDEKVTEPSDALMESEYADQDNNDEEVTEPSDALRESEATPTVATHSGPVEVATINSRDPLGLIGASAAWVGFRAAESGASPASTTASTATGLTSVSQRRTGSPSSSVSELRQETARLGVSSLAPEEPATAAAPTKPQQRKLPVETPDDFVSAFSGRHPLADHVDHRRGMAEIPDEKVSILLPPNEFRAPPANGYHNGRFAKSIFLRSERAGTIPFPYFGGIEQAIRFRKQTYTIERERKQLRPVAQEAVNKERPQGKPHYVRNPFRLDEQGAVLAQVLSLSHNRGLLVETKDLFVTGNDRLELRFLAVDQTAEDIGTGRFGYDQNHLSVGDFLWIYSAKATKNLADAASEKEVDNLIQQAANSNVLSTEESRPCFRVDRFALVEPAAMPSEDFALVYKKRMSSYKVKSISMVSSGMPELVNITPARFPNLGMEHFTELTWFAVWNRRATPFARYFSESPISKMSRDALIEIARQAEIMEPEGGRMPLTARRINFDEVAWLQDRPGTFSRYNRTDSYERMAKVFGTACAMLNVLERADEDKKPHRVDVEWTVDHAPRMTIDITMTEMSGESGFCVGRLLTLSAPAMAPCLGAVLCSDYNPHGQELHLRVLLDTYSTSRMAEAMRVHGTVAVPGRLRISLTLRMKQTDERATPVLASLAEGRLFDGVLGSLHAQTLLNRVYANRLQSVPSLLSLPFDNIPAPTIEVVKGGKRLTLHADQASLVRAIAEGEEHVALGQATYGAGKTLTAALGAAQFIKNNSEGIVVLMATTNAAVLQLSQAFESLDEYAEVSAMRFASEHAIASLPTTRFDVDALIAGLCDKYTLTEEETSAVRRFVEGRSLVNEMRRDPTKFGMMSEAEARQYRLAERDASDLAAVVLEILLAKEQPRIVFCTTATTLNAFGNGGSLAGMSAQVRLVVADEASMTPEPVLCATASVLPNARQVWVGDHLQLPPHCRAPRGSAPEVYAARSVMATLLQGRAHVTTLRQTFRSHPGLSSLAADVAYGATLSCATSAAERQLFYRVSAMPEDRAPLVLALHRGAATRPHNGVSWENQNERAMIVDIVSRLTRRDVSPASILVVAIYKEQARRLRRALQSMGVRVETADAVQGSEADLVFVATTRSSGANEEFFGERARAVVALTRARHGMVILGHPDVLSGTPIWNAVMTYTRQHGVVTHDEMQLQQLIG